MTTRILRTLLYKEMLRYRYNWGMLVMVLALLALAGLVSVAGRVQTLPGQAGPPVERCLVFSAIASPEATAWIAHLRRHPPPPPHRVDFDTRVRHTAADGPSLPAGAMAIEVLAPTPGVARGAWRARYWHGPDSPASVLPYRDWLSRETRRFLRAEPSFEEETRAVGGGVVRTDRAAMIITALVVFSLYLPSFSLYIATSGEEREKRTLLALLLTPATPAQVVGAKAGFYALVSTSLAAAVVALYDPSRLLQPMLWSTIVVGSIGYLAMGTLVVAFVRRQATLSTASMLYLVGTTTIMILSGFLPLFGRFRRLLLEDYVYRQMHQILSGQTAWWVPLNQLALIALSGAWLIAAILVVRRKGLALARTQ